MRKQLPSLIAAVVVAGLTAALAAAGGGADRGPGPRHYAIGFWGDLPYSAVQRETGVPNLIEDMNRQRLAFSVHAGDIKSGSSRCDDEVYAQAERYFNSFEAPAMYTPGDNEWTDCDRPSNGGYSSRERLEFIRANLFDSPSSFGQRRMALEHQARPYVENARWERDRVVYATLHVVGSDNNRSGDVAPDPAEWQAREEATNRWMRETFARARQRNAAAVMLVAQANPGFDRDDPNRAPVRDPRTLAPEDGFASFLRALREETIAFRKPVVLVHGDSHYFRVDKPLLDSQGRRLETFTRLEVPGDNPQNDNNDVQWVKVAVDPRSREVFSFQPQVVPGNRVAVPPPAPPSRLLGRAILPADAYQPGPPSGAAVAPDNGVTPPFPGQPIPGFSAVLDAGRGRFWAMPDNGFGSKTNSGDFLLRLYLIRPDFKTARGGSGRVDVLRHIQLRDPDRRIPFSLQRADRLLTGADFDLESVRRTPDGDLWFGEEFGPFLLHTDARGKVLEAPHSLPGVQSPQNPFLANPDAWTIGASRGFEGMALSADGRRLYPVLEGALRSDPDPRRRVVNEFDLRRGEYTDRKWSYRVDAGFPNAVIGDFTALDRHRFLAIERDDAQGAEARQKKIYLVDLRRTDRDGYLKKRLVLDLLQIRDPNGISLPARPGELGVGDPFSFPLQSVESLEVLGGRRLLIANDNNYPGSDGRWAARDRPDDVELIVVRTPALR